MVDYAESDFQKSLSGKKVQKRIRDAHTPKQPIEPKTKESK